MMVQHVRFIVFFICIVVFGFVETKKSEVDYEVFVDQVTAHFIKEMNKKYGLHCMGTGGGMPYDVESIKVNFTISRKESIEEAREIMVNGVEMFLKMPFQLGSATNEGLILSILEVLL